jgi:hypothetical protein
VVPRPVVAVLGGAALVAAAAVVGLVLGQTHHAPLIEVSVQVETTGARTLAWADSATGRRMTVTRLPHTGTVRTLTRSTRGSLQSEFVDYRHRTWTSTIATDAPADLGAVPTQSAQAAAMRAEVRRGFYRIVGRESVGGRATIHLAHRARLTNSPVAALTEESWVDAATYLPVRLRTSIGGLSATTDYTWVPRTAANLAKLELVVPRGFRHVHSF